MLEVKQFCMFILKCLMKIIIIVAGQKKKKHIGFYLSGNHQFYTAQQEIE